MRKYKKLGYRRDSVRVVPRKPYIIEN